MPKVACPSCRKSVALPDPPTAAAYTCPHCRRPIPVSAPSAPTPPPPIPSKPAAFDFEDEDEEPASSSRSSRPSRRSASGNPIGDFFVFRLMVTPLIIQIVFWLGILICVWVGVRMILEALDEGPMKRSIAIIPLATGVTVTLLGPLIWRVYCELAMVFFKIHEELKEMNDRTRYRS